MRRLQAGIILAAASAAVCGCSGSKGPHTVPVSGTVTLDGQPLAGAEVHFVGPGFSGFGKTGPDGKYRLVQGAVPGENRVYITKKVGGEPSKLVPGFGQEGLDEGQLEAAAQAQRDPETGQIPPQAAVPRELIPADYSDPANTKLTYTVPDGGASGADFALTSQ